jgi:pimeloyl-ACP methyl ester carboxylesterase
MTRGSTADGFALAYTDTGRPTLGNADAVVLLHGWPGDSTDYRVVGPLLEDVARVVIPDLRGFGESDRHLRDPDSDYSASAQARSIAGLITELGLQQPVIAGYDVGSRIAQTVAQKYPALVGGLALSPPLPGAGARVLHARMVPELWYQYFHRSPVSVALLDGQRDKLDSYLRHFWTHWSGPGFVFDGPEFEALVDRYARPGAFQAASNWYRVGEGYIANAVSGRTPHPSDRISVPTHILWQDLDPLFPRAWADRIDDFFSNATVHPVDGVGHFTPLEAPHEFAGIVREALGDRAS